MTDFRAEGEKLHHDQPDMILAEVWHHAPHGCAKAERLEFVEGYQAARARRDAFLAEQKENPSNRDPDVGFGPMFDRIEGKKA